MKLNSMLVCISPLRYWLSISLLVVGIISGCAPSAPRDIPTLASIQITPMVDTYFQSIGGGEPRSPAYWLIWNTCAEGNKAETARTNGGREAGWILMDDMLANPGMLVGALQVEACQQGVSLLQTRNLQNTEMNNDAAYVLATQLLAAQLNLAAGAESCSAAEDAVGAAQLLLISLSFNGTGIYLGPPAAGEDRDTALILADQLNQYNNGTLCVPG